MRNKKGAELATALFIKISEKTKAVENTNDGIRKYNYISHCARNNGIRTDVLIASGGALVKYNGEYIYKAEFSKEETRRMITFAREICGVDCEITIDTVDSHYWNYKIDPKKQDHSWGDSIYTDFTDFEESSLKMCVEIFEERQADLVIGSNDEDGIAGYLAAISI